MRVSTNNPLTSCGGGLDQITLRSVRPSLLELELIFWIDRITGLAGRAETSQSNFDRKGDIPYKPP